MGTSDIAVTRLKNIYNQLIECNDVYKVYITSDAVLHIFKNGQPVLKDIYNNSDKYCEVTDLYDDYINGIDNKNNVTWQIFDRMIEFYEV